ncbi:MAG: dual specificity protein phosphatase family protein [Chlamydiales bacterium]|nr:dual specificity protein phosphatase family protein [Chlamydiales bacterium]
MSFLVQSGTDLYQTAIEQDRVSSQDIMNYHAVAPLTYKRAKNAVEVDYRVQEATKGVFKKIGDFFGKIINGDSLMQKIGLAILVGAVAGIAAAFFFSNPIGWIVFGSVVVVTLIAQLIIPTIKDAYVHDVGFGQMLAFKFSAWKRSLNDKNYDHVFTAQNGAKIFLGALPNHNTFDLSQLVLGENIGAVISVNEPWERKEIGVSRPYTSQEYRDAGINYYRVDADDHRLLERNELVYIADAIDMELAQGRNVYIHCRAGVGRSAMGVAAYLMMFQDMSADAAANQIKYGGGDGKYYAPGRKDSTIMRKLDDKVDKHSEIQVGLRNIELFDQFVNQ